MSDIEFSSSLAQGASFCNREQERERLAYNIEHLCHTLIVSPRRYGKTSLILKVLEENKLLYGRTHFFNAFSDELILKRFLEAFNGLLSQIVSPTQKALKMISKLISSASLSLKIDDMQVGFNLQPHSEDPLDTIVGLLKNIESILRENSKHAVIFLDEFQDIVNADMSDQLQAVLRDFIQQSKYLTFVISGSNRHMLEALFDDRNKPFYKLFDRMNLLRIKEDSYKLFLNKAAKKTWQNTLPDSLLKIIFSLTECHAYYLNRLCYKLFFNKKIPDIDAVKRAWSELVDEEFTSVAGDVSALSKNQRIVLQEVARCGFVKQPNAQVFLSRFTVTARTVSQVIDKLNRLDFIEQTTQGYRVIDPVLRYVLLSE